MDKLHFMVDAAAPTQRLAHFWEKCVGSCHGYTALREDYRKQLKRARVELGFQYVRFHGILDDDMCVVQETAPGKYSYNFFNIDNIFDFLLRIGMKPFMEISFMPTAFASGTQTCFHYKGNVTPPKDYPVWDAFITAMVRHFVDRYGLAEVRQWFFEVWNEPNLQFFFSGTQEDYFALYEHTARAIKAVDSCLQVGGPATALNAWVPELIGYCKTQEAPLDFISTHHYPTDDPLWNSGMSVENFFAEMVKKEQEGDKDVRKKTMTYERGVLAKMTAKTREQAEDYPLYYTEWNTSAILSDECHDHPYGAALVTKTVLDNIGYVDAYSFWTFTDIFEEQPQRRGEFHGGFGLQTIHGIPKPVYRAFELLHQLGSEQYPRPEEQGNAGMLATVGKDGEMCVIVYNQQIQGGPSGVEEIELTVAHGNASGAVICRVDESHANPRKLWDEMGCPEYPDAGQMDRLYRASCLEEEPLAVTRTERGVQVSFALPKDGIALIKMH